MLLMGRGKKYDALVALLVLVMVTACAQLPQQVPEPLIQKVIEQQPAEAGCTPTARNPGGPYYRTGTPLRTNIAEGEAGRTLFISGTVQDTSCNPIPEALIEVWHTSNEGRYDTSPAMRYRGSMMTDEDGRYVYQTIVPGTYGFARAPHIHYKISLPGFKDLFTQLYLKGESSKTRDSLVVESLIIDHEQLANGSWTGTFDIVLERQ